MDHLMGLVLLQHILNQPDRRRRPAPQAADEERLSKRRHALGFLFGMRRKRFERPER